MGKFALTPSLAELEAAAGTANLAAVSLEIALDMDTPVSVYYKLVGKGPGFILESADTSKQAMGRYSFIGVEPFMSVKVFKDKLLVEEKGKIRSIAGSPAEALDKLLAQYEPLGVDKLPSLANGGLVGYLNYEAAATFDKVRGLQIAEDELVGQFMLCRSMVIFDQVKNTALIVSLFAMQGQLAVHYRECVQNLQQLAAALSAPQRLEVPAQDSRRRPVNFMGRYKEMPDSFLKMVHTAKQHILAGDVFQIVPSCQFKENLTKPPFAFYRRLRQVNPSPYMFYIDFGEVKLVGASPEMLVKVIGRTVYTYPIAGTRKRGCDDAEDEVLAADLQADAKECAEHAMLVDLARNDIGRISQPGSVRVTKLQQIERFSHVIHMVSEVEGKLQAGYTAVDVLKACFPAGTVSGAPKLRAMEIINVLEPAKRASYAGTVGYLDFSGNMDMCITLRTLRIEAGTDATVQSGAGIVADSVAEREYSEILQKSKALFTVIEEVENDDIVIG